MHPNNLISKAFYSSEGSFHVIGLRQPFLLQPPSTKHSLRVTCTLTYPLHPNSAELIQAYDTNVGISNCRCLKHVSKNAYNDKCIRVRKESLLQGVMLMQALHEGPEMVMQIA